MKVAVTGANGFVGRAVVTALAESRLEAVPIVRRPIGLPNERRVDALSASTDWSLALQGCEIVVHLAARVHVMNDKISDPLAAFRAVNLAGTLQLAQQAAEAGVKRLVFVSTAKVFGESTAPGTAFRADDVIAPNDPYAVSKAEAEAALFKTAAETGIEIVVVRPPLVYGPGAGANFLTMLRWVQRGVPLPLGTIDNSRSLVGLEVSIRRGPQAGSRERLQVGYAAMVAVAGGG